MHKKHLFKTLALSMLAAISVMAMSASAAQAKWLILVGGKSVAAANFKGTLSAGTVLVPGLLGFRCTGGTVSVSVKTIESGAKVVGSGAALVTGCVVTDSTGNVNKNCTVNSPGEPAGSVKGSGSSEGQMEGSKYFATIESANFTEVNISGGLCPLDEFDATGSGSATITLLNAETAQVQHTLELASQELFYGENEAILHDGVNPENPLKGNGEEESGSAWSVELVGL